MYNSYEEIGKNATAYILSVSDADTISDIPLHEINDFLDSVNDHIDEKGEYHG